MGYAFQYTEVYGIELESQYPFEDQTGVCKYRQDLAQFGNAGF